jgi:hypothetical protein
MNTKAQTDQIAKALDALCTETRDLDPTAVAVAILGLCDARGDMTGAALEELANEIGRLGHMRGRAAA